MLNPKSTKNNYVNIDLRHQYEIYVTETETFPLAKRPERRGSLSISLTRTKD